MLQNRTLSTRLCFKRALSGPDTAFSIVRQAEEIGATTGIEYIVPILAGLGRQGVMEELPALLQVKRVFVGSAGAVFLPFCFRPVGKNHA